jgi:hypothetical protein
MKRILRCALLLPLVLLVELGNLALRLFDWLEPKLK